MEAKEVREKSLIEYLANMGIQPVRSTSRSSVFYSPFRDEDFPSFHVYPDNHFNDYGNGAGGSIIDFVMELKKCDFPTAMKILEHGRIIDLPDYDKKPRVVKPGIEIVSVNDIHSEHLISYLKERCIPMELASLWLRQIEFRFPEGKAPGTIHSALGFKNDSNAYELRSARWKVSNSPKNVTTIIGSMAYPVFERTIFLFEGFFDFLSALTHGEIEKFPGKTIILNSLGFIHSILPILKDAGRVHLYIDTGKAANEKIEMMKAEGVDIDDRRGVFVPYGDYNEFLMGKNL